MVATCYFQPLSEESSSTVLDQIRESVAKITVTPQKKATAEMLDQSAINEEGLCASMRNVVEITPKSEILSGLKRTCYGNVNSVLSWPVVFPSCE